MPVYCYRRDNKLIERVYKYGEAPVKVKHGGVLFYRDFAAEHVGTRPAGNWPMESYSVGVLPEQVAEAEAHSREIGVPTHFTKNGDAILTSPAHRKRYCEALGYIDRNGGYSDPQPK